MDTKITYLIIINEKRVEAFDFALDADDLLIKTNAQVELPEWTKLEFQQCSHCPLNKEEHEYCPVAAQLAGIIGHFEGTSSIDTIKMEVFTEERRVVQTTPLQSAIASMLELVFPACGCPKTELLRPLSHFHLPLASEEETVFRVTSMYLLGQYFVNTTNNKGRIDFTGLIDAYNDLNVLNRAVASRIKNVTTSDSVKNAIALLDMYSNLVPLLVEDQLVEMRGFFKAFLPEEEGEQSEVTTEYVKKNTYLESFKAASLALEPLDEEKEGKPDWLTGLEEPEITEVEEPKEEEKPEEPSQIDLILQGSSLSLEPIEGEKSKTGKASFLMSDDDESE